MADAYMNLVFQNLIRCYNINKAGSDIAKCMEVVKKANNPNNYKTYLNIENVSKQETAKVTLIFYTPEGLKIECIGTAREKISIKQCIKTQGSPLTPGQERSINPP